jgi:hypothetical protein
MNWEIGILSPGTPSLSPELLILIRLRIALYGDLLERLQQQCKLMKRALNEV